MSGMSLAWRSVFRRVLGNYIPSSLIAIQNRVKDIMKNLTDKHIVHNGEV